MSEANEEYRETEETLRRVRPQEPSAELKARIVGAAREAWREAPATVAWQIPLRRLTVSAAAAVLIAALANLYGDCTSAYRPMGAPRAGLAEPCDLDAMIDAHTPLIRYLATAGRQAQPALADHLVLVREALRETERSATSEEPAPHERKSRLPVVPSSLHS